MRKLREPKDCAPDFAFAAASSMELIERHSLSENAQSDAIRRGPGDRVNPYLMQVLHSVTFHRTQDSSLMQIQPLLLLIKLRSMAILTSINLHYLRPVAQSLMNSVR